jgi:superfamily II DNA helicase RecQ
MDGVFLNGINQMALAMHPMIFEFDADLRASSEALANITEDAADESEPDPEAEGYIEVPAPYDKALFERLKKWRLERAKKDQLPAYIVAHDKLLEELARRKPQTSQSLLGVKGMGQGKLDRYGPDILAIITQE